MDKHLPSIISIIAAQLWCMVRKTFGIYSDDLSTCRLSIETGVDYIACWCVDHATMHIKALELFNFDNEEIDDFEKLFGEVKPGSRLLSENTGAVQLVWTNDQAVCVPEIYFSEELVPSLFETVYGITGEIQYSINSLNNMIVVGNIPVKTAGVYAETFKVSGNNHKYFDLLNAQKSGDNRQIVYVVFNHNSFIYTIYKDGKLQLIQMHRYRTAEDVLYHLLNALTVFEMPVSETVITVSGMIDGSSPLYKNLYAHFNHFSFSKMDESKFSEESFKKYPLHYFASFC